MDGDALVPNRHQAICNHYADSTVTTVSQKLYYTKNIPMGFFVAGKLAFSQRQRHMFSNIRYLWLMWYILTFNVNMERQYKLIYVYESWISHQLNQLN